MPRLVSKARGVHSWVYWQKQSRWLQPLIHLPSASNWQKQNPNCTEMWDVWFLSFFNTCRVLKNWCFRTMELEKTLESPLDSKESKPVNPKGNQPWILNRRIAAEAGILWPPDMKSQLIGKYPDAGKDWKQKRVTEDKMVRWHHWFNGHKLGQTPGDGEGGGAWCAAVHGVANSWTRPGDWITTVTPAVSETLEDFPGGPVVRNLPRNEGDLGLISGWGTKIPYATEQLLSPHALELTCHN